MSIIIITFESGVNFIGHNSFDNLCHIGGHCNVSGDWLIVYQERPTDSYCVT